MTREEFLELQKKHREEESRMTIEEREALKQARRRHSRKVRDEILTSFEISEQKKKASEEE